MKPKRRSFFETLAVHGLPPSHAQGPDLAPSIRLSSTFRFESAEQAAGVFDGSEDGYVYSRIANPTVDQLQEKMAVLEKGEAAVAVASGMAAIASAALTLARPGDNFVSCTTVYGGTFAFFNRDLARFDIEARFIPPAPDLSVAKLDELIDAKTRFLYMETPANPTLDILDIEKWAVCAKSHRIPLIVDNTFATPYLQSPLSLGAEGVVHSATKYLGGACRLYRWGCCGAPGPDRADERGLYSPFRSGNESIYGLADFKGYQNPGCADGSALHQCGPGGSIFKWPFQGGTGLLPGAFFRPRPRGRHATNETIRRYAGF
jgi:hypothetical protein